jgi:uncharacterized ferredoxin-like protein
MEDDEKRAVVEVGRLMALSARTAPKGKGMDYLEIRLLSGDDVRRLGKTMEAHAEGDEDSIFLRDGGNVQGCPAVLIICLLDHPAPGLDCNGCGHGTCEEFLKARKARPGGDFDGPFCAIRVLDLGIAVSSAAKTAQLHNVDNRVMYTAGVTAIAEGFVGPGLALGIPLSASGKSPFFDR